MKLSDPEHAMLDGADGPGPALAMRLVTATGAMLGAEELVPISSAHIDGCIYLGDGGAAFAEHLVALGARTRVPTTLNIGSLDLLKPDNVRLSEDRRRMALRQMQAYERLGCRPTWTCAPYQAGHRPEHGAQVAWGESNAVAFCNSVLGARTNRYGDFLDIACAIVGRAPLYGLHLDRGRRARIVFDVSSLSSDLRDEDAFWPALGAWVGARAGDTPPAVVGLEGLGAEDRLKAFGAAAAAFGAVALFHIVGVTPEAPTLDAALQGGEPDSIETVGPAEARAALDMLSTTTSEAVTAVGIGSPHLSFEECQAVVAAFDGRRSRVPFYANTGRHVVERLRTSGDLSALDACGVTMVADTCIVATPILEETGGVLMTNSAKFAHYAPGNIGHDVLYGGLADCIETAVAGRLVRDLGRWS